MAAGRIPRWLAARDARVPTRLQFQTTECGVAALGMVLAHHGQHVTTERLRELTGVSRDCVNGRDMARAARQLGFACKAYSREPEALADLPRPFLAHLRFIHFVVVEGFCDGYVLINDPSVGRSRIPAEKFREDFTGIVLVVTPEPGFVAGAPPPHPKLALWQRLDSTSRRWLAAAIAAACGAALAIPPLALTAGRLAADLSHRASQAAPDASAHGLVLVLLSAVLATLLGIQSAALQRLQGRIAVSETRRLSRHIASMNEAFFSYRLPSRIHQVLYSAEDAARELCTYFLPALLTLISGFVACAGLAVVDGTAAAVSAVAITSASAATLVLFHFEGDRLQIRRATSDGQLNALLFGKDELERSRLNDKGHDFVAQRLGAQARFHRAGQESAPIEGLAAAIATSVTLVAVAAAAWPVVTGASFGLAETFGAILLASAAAWPVRHLLPLRASWETLSHLLLIIEDVLACVPVESESPARARDDDPPRVDRGPFPEGVILRARGLRFGYSAHRAPLVDGVDLDVARGEQLGLTGPSGGGKSTLCALLSGSLPPWSGWIDGPASSSPPARDAVACVDKSSFFFEGTVRENLCLWRQDVSEETLQRAIEDACLDEVLRSREGGIDAAVQMRGRNFSGGQQQRMEIARALLGNPRVLVLDEATDALDPALEARVRANIRRRGCSVVIVSHRASTLAACDRVLRIVGGGIEEGDGSRAEPVLDTTSEPAGPPVLTETEEATPPAPGFDEAVRHVARLLGVRTSRTDTEHAESSADVEMLARRHGLRARRVRFAVTSWWNAATLPLIVFRRDTGAALVMWRKGVGRGLFDPRSGNWEPVFPQDLRSDAFQFHVPPDENGRGTWTRIQDAVVRGWPEFAVAEALSVATALCFLILPWLAAGRLSTHSAGRPADFSTAVGLGAIAAAAFCFEYSRSLALSRAFGLVELSLMSEFTQRLVRLKAAFVSRTSAVDLARGLTGLQRMLASLQSEALRPMADAVLALLLVLILLNLEASLGLLAAGIAMSGILLPLLATRAGRADENWSENARLASRRFLHDVLKGISRLRLLNSGHAAMSRWVDRYELDVKQGRRVEGMNARLLSLRSFFPWLGLAAFLFASGALGGLSKESVVTVALVWWPLTTTALELGIGGVAFLRTGRWARQCDLLATAQLEPAVAADAPPPLPIDIRDLSYRYEGTSSRALNGVSLRIEPGEFLAITGPSGGGKSTLLKLLVGADAPETGEIKVGTREHSMEEKIAWRRTVGLVSQDERVEFSTTIRSQIGGHGVFHVRDIWDAARLTLLAGDIARMPMGLFTIVETGTMSTGQQQRLLIAREVVRRPKVLILDEATNAISDAVQEALFANLRRLGMTLILVTHRETALRLMDRVVVLEDGRLSWSGPPEALAAQKDVLEMIRAERLEGHQ